MKLELPKVVFVPTRSSRFNVFQRDHVGALARVEGSFRVCDWSVDPEPTKVARVSLRLFTRQMKASLKFC